MRQLLLDLIRLLFPRLKWVRDEEIIELIRSGPLEERIPNKFFKIVVREGKERVLLIVEGVNMIEALSKTGEDVREVSIMEITKEEAEYIKRQIIITKELT